MADAKITVEASLIIPLIISIICALLYEALLGCDRGVINMTADRVIEEACVSGKSYDESNETVELSELIRDEISKRIMLYSVNELKCEIKRNKITLSVYAVPKVKFGIAYIFRGAFGEYRISREAKIENICVSVRRMDIVKDNAQ
ncbi:MAG: hypothetical protein HFH14_03790 [Lachnospiraceae bacterium]|nr:hypothetical protein [Lachnospiraceae bacterium]